MKTIEMECFEATKFMELASQATEIRVTAPQLDFLRSHSVIGPKLVITPPHFGWSLFGVDIKINTPLEENEPRNIVFVLKEYEPEKWLPITPHKQLFLHEPEKGINGDCTRAVIASMLNKENVEDVPHFGEGLDFSPEARDVNGPLFEQRIDAYLLTQGLRQFKIAFVCSLEELMAFMAGNVDVPYIVDGSSVRGRNHSVIYMNGKMIHDPHPHNSGIVGPMDNDQIHVSVLVPVPHGEHRFKG